MAAKFSLDNKLYEAGDGRRLGIARQNVTKRLRAAGWPAFDAAMKYIASSLAQAGSTQPSDTLEAGVQGRP